MATTVSPSPSVPYARARLRLGITGVGTSVLLATAWLAVLTSGLVRFDAAWAPLGASRGPLVDAAIAALFAFAAQALLLFPTELSGGTVVVRKDRGLGAWLVAWGRGVVVQAAIVACSAAVLAAAAVAYESDVAAPVAAATALTAVMIAAQGGIARLVAALRVRRAEPQVQRLAAENDVEASRLRIVEAPDEGFVGGWVGLFRPILWVPAHWAEPSRAGLLAVQFARRAHQRRSGARLRGVLGTLAWNAAGMLLVASLLPWGFAEARTFLVLPAAATLWSFLGVLVLPTPSRTAVYAADRAVAQALGTGAVTDAIATLDRWQDDEEERRPGVERVFHPVPSRGNRLRALAAAPAAGIGAHQLTRTMLATTPATLSLLGRAVHCNIGRPSLWVVFPGD